MNRLIDKYESAVENIKDSISSPLKDGFTPILIQSKSIRSRLAETWGETAHPLHSVRDAGILLLQTSITSALWQLERTEYSLVDALDRALASPLANRTQQLPFLGDAPKKAAEAARSLVSQVDTRIRSVRSHTVAAVGLLPIDGYDNLTAKEVILALPGLSAEETQAVRQYEANHKNRTSVLKHLDRLSGH